MQNATVMSRTREAIQAASTFLSASVATETGLPLIERLYNGIPTTWEAPKPNLSKHTTVILSCFRLLVAIHNAVQQEKAELGVKDFRQVNALIDIIMILGVYKSLPPGVGPPEGRRIKSVMLDREGQRDELPLEERRMILEAFISHLTEIMGTESHLGSSFRQRFRVDVLASLGDLGFDSVYPEEERDRWKGQYEVFLST
jgi:hypothetical protein